MSNVKQYQIKEIRKCASDPVYFFNKYVKIQHPTRGAIPFDTFDFQNDCVKDFLKYRFSIVLKARQLGLSTVTAAYALWMVIFRENVNILVIATKLSTAKNFIKKCKYMLKNLPPWLVLCDIASETVQTIETSRGSILKAVPTSDDAGRSEALSLLIVDEAAFVRDFDELWKGLYPTLSCLTGDTLVLSNNGYKRIESYFKNKNIGDYFDLPEKTWGMYGIEEISHGYVSPKSKILEIETQSGAKLKITPHHPLYSIKEYNKPKMIPGNCLSVGDHLRFSFGMNSFGKESIGEDLAYMVGGYIAEGWMTGRDGKDYVTWVSNTDEDFRSVFLRNGFVVDKLNDYKLRNCSINFCNQLKEIGIESDKKCWDKITPENVLSWDRKSLSQYLSGLFDGDGSVSENGVILSSTSRRLLEETKIILSNFGIYANINKNCDTDKKLIYEKNIERLLPQGKPVQSLHDSWSIVIPRSQMKLFFDEIGFKIKRKQNKLKEYINLFEQNSRKIFQIPKTVVINEIKEIIKKSNKSKYWFRKNGLRLDKVFDKNVERYINQDFLSKLKSLIDKRLAEEYSFFFDEFLSSGNVRWERIVSIKESEEEYITYDFTVPGTHSFLQNGILGSNTGGRAILLSCVTKDTWIFTKKGPTQIKNFIDKQRLGGYEIDEYSILGRDKLRSGHLFHNNGKVKIKKIKTQHSWINGSENHKVFAYSNGKYEWFRLDELSEGDYIAHQYNQNCWGNSDDISDYKHIPSSKEKNIFFTPEKKITKNIAYYFGLYLAEGSNYKHYSKGNLVGNSNTITCGDDVNFIFDELKLNANCYDKMHHSVSSKSFGLFLEYIGFDLELRAPQKIIPDRLMQMSAENIASMLSGMFDGDGYSRSDRGTIGISLSSKAMIEQIRILLNNFGILTDYYEGTTPKTKKVNVESPYFRLEINGRYSKVFYEKIGFRFYRKQSNKSILENNSNLSVKNTKDIVPNSLDLIKEMYSYSSLNSSKFYNEYGIFINGIVNRRTLYKTSNISRELCIGVFDVVKKEIKDPEKIKEIEKIISPTIKWDRIKSIEDGYEETFDFSLPEKKEDFWCHSVIYNGLLGHQTPNGTGNKFFEIYDKAEKNEALPDGKGKKTKFHPIKLPWNVHPERDQEWYEEETANMNPKDIAQELECDFAASGDTFLDASILERIRLQIKEPIARVGEDRNVWIWENPKIDHKYIVSADTARGDGKDYSTFHIFDATEGRVVSEYQGKMPPDRFADLINEFGLLYNKALVCPENNSVGYATIQRLCHLQYPRVYNNKERTLDVWSKAGNSGELQKPSGDLGIFTSAGKRNVLLTKLEEFLRNERVEIWSSRLYKELKTFVWVSQHKVEAEKNNNDDLVMSLAIGLWLLDTADFSRYSEEHGKALLDSMSQSSSMLDDLINDKVTKKGKDDYSVLLPVAGNAEGFSRRLSGKTTRAQVINSKWNWLMS